MKDNIEREEGKDKNSNKLPEQYIKRARISANILFILAIIILIVLFPVAISCFIEKDYSPAIIITIFLFVIEIPLFLLVYVFKKKPEKIIHPEESFVLINSKRYKTVRNAIVPYLNKIYGVDKPDNVFKVPILYMRKYGGEVPIEQIIVYDCREYFHFITIGMSGLCDSRGKSLFEYTFKLKKKNVENFDLEIEHTYAMLSAIATSSLFCSELTQQYQTIPGVQGKGMDLKEESKISGFITIPDSSINSMNIQNIQVDFIELVGVTDLELKSIENNQLTVKELYEKMGTDITDYERDSVI